MKEYFKNGWKVIFLHLSQYKNEIILLSVLGIISAIANGSIPYVVGRFFDAILEIESVAQIFTISVPLWTAFLIL